MQSSSLLIHPSSSLLTLPVEVLYRILDQLKSQDILLSFRNVCTKCRVITDTYNRLTIELSNHPSDSRIQRLYRIISPKNVVALTLRKYYSTTEFNDIDWFFSSADIHQFTRLRFVYLESINERDIRTIMRHLGTISTLNSLKIFDRNIPNDDTIALLSMVIALPCLRKLNLDVSSRTIDKISWPDHGTFQELNLKKCSYKQWCYILHHSPYLRIASTADFDMNNIDKTVHSISYEQVISLTLNDIRFSINLLETLLLSYPSLVYLDLTANGNPSFNLLERFSRLEYFIREKLPRLETFHFKISTRMSHYRDIANIKSIIATFRTPFWLEQKRWYVKFQYVINETGSFLILRSLMNTNIDIIENSERGFISYFTSTTKDDDGPKMDSVWTACFDLVDASTAIDFRQFKVPNYYLFKKVIRLVLDIDWYVDWSRSGSLELLSKLIDLSQLKEVCFWFSNRQTLEANTINMILTKAPNVRTFEIRNNGSLRGAIEKECAAISSQIEHFTIQSPDTTTMRLILEHVKHLSTVIFKRDWSSPDNWTKMIKWLREKEIKFSVSPDYRSLQVWFKKNIVEST